MRNMNSFINNNWTSTYTSTDQLWMIDSLGWEKISTNVSFDWSLVSFIFQSSYINQYFFLDQVSKFSQLDFILLQSNFRDNNHQTLYVYYLNDIILHLNTIFLPLSPLLQSEYQDTLNTTLLLSPELTLVFTDFFYYYYSNNILITSPTIVYDGFINNTNFYLIEGMVYFLFFIFFIFFIIYIFLTTLTLKWSLSLNPYFIRIYYYFYTFSKETRIQFEAVAQTLLLALFYWVMVLMSFDDDQEEMIELIDTGFIYLLTFVIIYFIYKHSIHFFSFLDSSTQGSSASPFKQFQEDFIGLLSVSFRFYLLALRLNLYDIFEDCFDLGYITIVDYDDDEYFNELLVSIHSTLFFTNDNKDDRSFLLEDESSFTGDLFVIYYLFWGKFFLFFFFTLEMLLKLSISFFLVYLITFEIHASPFSYKEDLYLNNMRDEF